MDHYTVDRHCVAGCNKPVAHIARNGLRITRMRLAPAAASTRADADAIAAVERKIGRAREPPLRFPAQHFNAVETAW